ncbi:helix-turn-helix domain-containing protein [Streptodolium elevatio]|uniref:Helix-turn-helix transcriptional regulator n=1 Tax=Streptodolium elevatio TaxID=3157996 RepID=A0ABV3DN85_9ACTN
MPATPSYARRRLGAALKSLRGGTGMSLENVAEVCGWDKSKLSRIENARVSLSRHDLHKLIDLYEAPCEELRRLETWMEDSRGPRWWTEYADILTAPYEELISLEGEASTIYTVNSCLIPGLLQSSAYAHATIMGSPFVPDIDDADALTQLRMKRQRILTGESPVEFTAIVSEASLHAEIGGVEVLRGQLEHLLVLGRLQNVQIRVVPFSATASTLVGAFTLVDFAGASEPSVVYVEYHGGAQFKDGERDVRRYRRSVEHVCGHALGGDESLQLIASRLEAL